MAISDNLGSVPKIFFAVFVSLVLGGLFLLVGLSTPHWLDTITSNAGLWQLCRTTVVGSICSGYPRVYFADIAYRGLTVVALLLAGGSGLAALAFVPMENRRKTLANLIGIGSILSFVANVIVNLWFGVAATIYAVGLSTHLGWSFVLSCLGSTTIFVSGILAFMMAGKITPSPTLPVSGVVLGAGPGYPHAGVQYNTQSAPGQPGAYPGQPGAYPYSPQPNPQQLTDKY